MSWIKKVVKHSSSHVFLAGIWRLWHWRNQCIFNDECWTYHRIMHAVANLV